MKNKISIILGILSLMLIPHALAGYEYTWRITPTKVVDRHNNFLIEHDGETWLIHHKSGCGEVIEGNELTLVIRGELDGNLDVLQKGTDFSCIVDQAELITGTLKVTKVSTADTTTLVQDAGGQEYRIYYSSLCKALKGQNGNDIYLRQYGPILREGDRIYLPGAGESCALTTVLRNDPLPPDIVPTPGIDSKHPTTPTRVRALPTKNAVYIYWDPATDEGGISHYIVNASLYHTEDARVREPGDLTVLDNEVVTPDSTPSLRLTDFKQDELYFFRVVAVDKAGNKSAYWSQEATAMTKSSIAEVGGIRTVLRVFQAQEAEDSFLLRWSNLPTSRYTVILTVDGERTLINNNWERNYIRISKTNAREGKALKLTVRSTDFRGNTLEDSVSFRF